MIMDSVESLSLESTVSMDAVVAVTGLLGLATALAFFAGQCICYGQRFVPLAGREPIWTQLGTVVSVKMMTFGTAVVLIQKGTFIICEGRELDKRRSGG